MSELATVGIDLAKSVFQMPIHNEAAKVMMTRCRADNWLKSWALGIVRRRGARKAKVALARRLAVVLHRMWIDRTEFSMERPRTMTA